MSGDPATDRRWTPLARRDAIADGGSAAFTLDAGDASVPLLAVRRGDDVLVYVNACPHIGLTLDLVPGQFLDRQRTHILCANHGALFRIDDGVCVAGPCRGEALSPVPVAVADDVVFVRR